MQPSCPWPHDAVRSSQQALFRPLTGPIPCHTVLWHNIITFAPDAAIDVSREPLPIQPADIPLIKACPTPVKRATHEARYHALLTAQTDQQHQARLRSTACRTAGAFLDTIHTSPKLSLSDGAFIDSCQYRLCVISFAPTAPPAQCACGHTIHGNDATHAMTCKHLPSSYQYFRNDTVSDAIRNVTPRAGLTSTREPLYRELDPTSDQAGQARGDIYTILTPGPGPTAIDTVVTHPGSVSALSRGSATTQGTAASMSRRRKHATFASHRVQSLTFKAFAIESYGYVDAEAMSFMRSVSQAAASTGHVTYGAFLTSAHRESSVALCRGNYGIFRSDVQHYTRASGHARLEGLQVPSDEVD